MLQHSVLFTIWFKPVFLMHGLMLEYEAFEALHLWETFMTAVQALYWCDVFTRMENKL